jgi:hypothetical protein
MRARLYSKRIHFSLGKTQGDEKMKVLIFKHKDSDDTPKVTVESSKDIYELSLSNVIKDLVLRNINWQEKRNKME